MQIVIEIPVGLKDVFENRSVTILDVEEMRRAIKNGTPLPKGHGRLIDADELRCENADFDTYNDYCTMFDEIDNADTVIEADKTESKDEE